MCISEVQLARGAEETAVELVRFAETLLRAEPSEQLERLIRAGARIIEALLLQIQISAVQLNRAEQLRIVAPLRECECTRERFLRFVPLTEVRVHHANV